MEVYEALSAEDIAQFWYEYHWWVWYGRKNK
jgi:hypothetical protein